jgi:hypothetical protein
MVAYSYLAYLDYVLVGHLHLRAESKEQADAMAKRLYQSGVVLMFYRESVNESDCVSSN